MPSGGGHIINALAERGFTNFTPPDMRTISAWGSSSIELAGSQLAAMAEGLGAEYIDGDKGSEWSHHIAARQGGVEMLATFPGNIIPASGTVDISISDFSTSSAFRPTHVVVAGVEGIVTSTAIQASFTRLAAGEAVAVASDVFMRPINGMRARTGLQILNVGKGNLTAGLSTDTVLAHAQACYDHVSSTPRRVIVMGHYVNRDIEEISTVRDAILTVNATWAAQYGDFYFDQQDYLMSEEVWTDTGIGPTEADLDHQAIGSLAPSLTNDGVHLNPTTIGAVVDRLRARLISLGWYEE